MRRTILVAALAATVLAACESRPELMRRYKSVESGHPASAKKSIDVGVFSLPVPSDAPKSMLDLAGPAQVAYLELVGKDRSVEEIGTAIATPFVAPPPPNADLGLIGRRLVLSVLDQGFGPADRLDRIEVAIELQPVTGAGGQPCAKGECPTFKAWTLFKTRHGDVDLGKATAKQGRSLEADLGLLPTQIREITDLSLQPKFSRELTEELQVKRRYVALAGKIEAERLRVLQQGATGIDLVGTSEVDVLIDLGRRESRRFYDFAATASGQPSMTSYAQLQPAMVCDLKGRVTATYRIRTVAEGNGDDTVIEGDDTVRFVGESEKKGMTDFGTHTLVAATDVGNPGYVLRLAGGGLLTVLRPSRPQEDANYETLRFPSLSGALDFLGWLKGAMRGRGPAPGVAGHRFKILAADGTQRRVELSAADAARVEIVGGGRISCPTG